MERQNNGEWVPFTTSPHESKEKRASFSRRSADVGDLTSHNRRITSTSHDTSHVSYIHTRSSSPPCLTCVRDLSQYEATEPSEVAVGGSGHLSSRSSLSAFHHQGTTETSHVPNSPSLRSPKTSKSSSYVHFEPKMVHFMDPTEVTVHSHSKFTHRKDDGRVVDTKKSKSVGFSLGKASDPAYHQTARWMDGKGERSQGLCNCEKYVPEDGNSSGKGQRIWELKVSGSRRQRYIEWS